MTTEPPDAVHHLALSDEWARVVAAREPYPWSTIEQRLDEVGYVHCALPHQVAGVVDRYYAGRVDDVVVLTVDPTRSEAPLVMENTSGGRELFPHLYGPITVDAVVAVEPLRTFLGRSGG
jgi:glutathione S-transferase